MILHLNFDAQQIRYLHSVSTECAYKYVEHQAVLLAEQEKNKMLGVGSAYRHEPTTEKTDVSFRAFAGMEVIQRKEKLRPVMGCKYGFDVTFTSNLAHRDHDRWVAPIIVTIVLAEHQLEQVSRQEENLDYFKAEEQPLTVCFEGGCVACGSDTSAEKYKETLLKIADEINNETIQTRLHVLSFFVNALAHE